MMYLIATFEHSLFVELALSALEQKGIDRTNILTAPLDKRQKPKKLFDTIHRADGISMFDLAAMLGTVFMLLGSIYGFVLLWGPIIWGIIGACFGLLLGFAIKYAIIRKRWKNAGGRSNAVASEIVVIVRCDPADSEQIENILWDNTALGISKVFQPTPT